MKKFEPLTGSSHVSLKEPVLYFDAMAGSDLLLENGVSRLLQAQSLLNFLMVQCIDDSDGRVSKSTIAEILGATDTMLSDSNNLLQAAQERAWSDKKSAETLVAITQEKGLELSTSTLLGVLPKRVEGGLLTSFIGCTNAQEAAQAWEKMVSSLESRQ